MIAIEDPLVILRRRDRNRAGAVAEREERDLGSDQACLDHEARPRGAEPLFVHRRADRRVRCRAIGRDDDPLPRREPVSLQHDGEAELARRDDRARLRRRDTAR